MTATAPSAPAPTSSGPSNRWMYWTIAIVVVVLAVIGLITYNTAKTNQQAKDKAQSLSQKFKAAGLPVPDQDVIIRSLGTDGGAVCANPANALGKATLNDMIMNGADFVGRRPVIVDSRILLGEALILKTYCPDKLKEYQDKINKLTTDDVVKQ
jgi:hypothetical protein